MDKPIVIYAYKGIPLGREKDGTADGQTQGGTPQVWLVMEATLQLHTE